MALVHFQCPKADDRPSVYVQAEDKRITCDHCGRTLMPFIDLPMAVPLSTKDPDLNRMASMMRRTVNVPIGLVTLIDQERSLIVGQQGLPEHLDRPGPRTGSFCQYVAMSSSPLIIEDASKEPLIADQLALNAEMNIKAYAGFPISDLDNRTIGTVCAIDHEVHVWTEAELELLNDYAMLASNLLRKRIALKEIENLIGRVTTEGGFVWP